MKTLKLTTVSLSCALGLLIIAVAQSTNAPPPDTAGQKTNAPALTTQAPAPVIMAPPATQSEKGAATEPAANSLVAPAAPATTETVPAADQAAPAPAKETAAAKSTLLPALEPNEVRLNFRNAPIESVLNYLSDATGLIIVPQTGGSLSGKVNMWSNQPVTKEEAIDLLGSALDQNGYAYVLNGRTLTIYTKSDAKFKPIPVKASSDPNAIPRDDQIVTQIIPVKFINAVQLSRDLQPLKPDSASWSANEGGNSLIVTDTQVNIHRLAEIVKALDTAISSVSSVKVFKLNYADAKAVASVIKDLFAPQDTARATGGNAAAARFMQQIRGGRGGFGGAGFGGASPGGGAQGGDTAGGGRAPTPRVVAVSEDRSNSVVVSAPDDQMPVIADMITQLDTTVEDVTEFKVFRLKFADAQETADLLTSLFSSSNYGSSGNQGFRAGQIMFGGRFGGPFGGGNRGGAPSTSDSARVQKQTQVVAVPDLRTSSVVVSAARDLMRQIEGMVAELDSDPARKQQVFVFDFQNTDPSQAVTVLQSLFPNQQYGMNNMRMNQNQAGTGNQLNMRSQASQNNMGRQMMGGGNRSGFGGNLSFGQ